MFDCLAVTSKKKCRVLPLLSVGVNSATLMRAAARHGSLNIRPPSARDTRHHAALLSIPLIVHALPVCTALADVEK